jgi:5-methylcytosine-specific restriction protein B
MGGGVTLLDREELKAKSAKMRDKYVYGSDNSPIPELNLHGTPKASIDLGNFDLSMQYAAGNVIAYEYALDQVSSHHSIVCQIRALIPVLEHFYKGEPQVAPEVDGSHTELDELVKQTYWSKSDLREVLASLQDKSPQIILEGPPGTGKTHVAKRIAHHLVGATYGEDSPDVTIVQFHPSYGYEEFVEGLRPDVSEGGMITFANQPGPILKIADKIAAEGRPHVLIIDELNRANIPRVFGELMYLLEYRDESIDLMLRQNFVLPKDLYIIATMNTADKSIRLMDAALRRRFDFFSVLPGEDILRSFYAAGENQNMIGEDLFTGFASLNAALKEEIGDDGYLIGHSFFMTEHMDKDFLVSRWKRQIGPLINEYFYDRQAPQQEFTLERFWAI